MVERMRGAEADLRVHRDVALVYPVQMANTLPLWFESTAPPATYTDDKAQTVFKGHQITPLKHAVLGELHVSRASLDALAGVRGRVGCDRVRAACLHAHHVLTPVPLQTSLPTARGS